MVADDVALWLSALAVYHQLNAKYVHQHIYRSNGTRTR
jgi:hypothetical protein